MKHLGFQLSPSSWCLVSLILICMSGLLESRPNLYLSDSFFVYLLLHSLRGYFFLTLTWADFVGSLLLLLYILHPNYVIGEIVLWDLVKYELSNSISYLCYNYNSNQLSAARLIIEGFSYQQPSTFCSLQLRWLNHWSWNVPR